MKKPRGRPKSTKPLVKRFHVSAEPQVIDKIDEDRGKTPRSKFLLTKSGYGGKK
jgi:hypothetical protein